MGGNKVKRRIEDSVRMNGFFLGASVGAGSQAILFDKYGVDFLVAQSTSRIRKMGRGEAAAILSYGNSNEITMEFAWRELLPLKLHTPVLFGFCATDPLVEVERYLKQVKALGFAGIMNCPSVGIFDGRFGRALEKEGTNFQKEVEAVKIAREMGLFTIAAVYRKTQKEDMENVGADIILYSDPVLAEKTGGDPSSCAGYIRGMDQKVEYDETKHVSGYFGEEFFEAALIQAGGQKNLRQIFMENQGKRGERWILQGKEDYVNYVKWYVARNYKKKLCFSAIAKEMNLSRSYLSTMFNQTMGCSFQEYIAEYRIQKAISMMGEKKVPLCVLAEMVGYEDYAHFSKVFKRKTGYSPRQYAG